ncbi:c-type cytochrome biogenesis protein CcmI [Sulfuricystis thermophila]|uniref:c-type cytochrome biogenesis protein CcmI n=1 Tax=Sulfuricystis thermophila TaxID=2496847 RepID=UPI0010359B67|nr:c-type cytochrome biogenesis protein CcmI [Sulfuricystis thermophila]
MTFFLIGAAALTLITLALLLWPLRRQSALGEASRREINAAIYRDELAELDRDLATGELSQADYDAAKTELQRRLLEDSQAEAGVADAGLPASRATAAALAITLPLGAALLYFLLGNPAALNAQASAAMHQQQFSPAEIERLVSDFAAKLENEPENYKGWAMLGRSYKALGRFPEAVRAYERTGPLLESSADLLVDYADTLAAAQGFDDKTLAVLDRALKLDPAQPQGLWLRGTAAFEAKQYDKAVADWEALLALLEPGSEDARAIEANIAEARQLGGLAPTPRQSAKLGADKTAPAGAAAIKGRVEIAPALTDKLPANGVLMVVARPADGSRMPVAVLRVPLGKSPLDFVLDDSLAMSPDRKPSQFAELMVEARVSATGQAMPQPGDLFGPAVKVKQGARDVQLLIDQVRQ